jgi:hypothetical protein
MKADIEKVVKEFIARIDSLPFSVKARISEILTGPDAGKYYWSISHHYSPTESGHTYFPDARTAITIEEVEMLLMSYLQGFTPFGIQSNQLY